jgi:hypothetical protein
VTCSRALALFIQTATLRDPVGEIAVGTKLKVDGLGDPGMSLVTVEGAPVTPLPPAHFLVKASDLASCVAMP